MAELENGVSAPQFNFAEAIEETVLVETALDTDFDGARDVVRIRISRPLETETEGYDVPVVFEQSPYRGDTGSLVNHNVDFDRMPQESLGTPRSPSAATYPALPLRVRGSTCRGGATRSTCRVDMPWCLARASARSCPRAAPTWVAAPRRWRRRP